MKLWNKIYNQRCLLVGHVSANCKVNSYILSVAYLIIQLMVWFLFNNFFVKHLETIVQNV